MQMYIRILHIYKRASVLNVNL